MDVVRRQDPRHELRGPERRGDVAAGHLRRRADAVVVPALRRPARQRDDELGQADDRLDEFIRRRDARHGRARVQPVRHGRREVLEAPVAGAVVGRVRAVALPFPRVAPQVDRVAVLPPRLAEGVRHDAGRRGLPRQQVRVCGRLSQAHDAVFFVEGLGLPQVARVAGDGVEECDLFGSERDARRGLRDDGRGQQRGGRGQKQRY